MQRLNNTDEVLLEPLSNLVNNNIMGAKCLVKVNKGRAALRLINPGDKCVHLKGNKVLAVVSEVVKENIFSLSSDAETKPNMSENSSKHNSKFHFDLDNSDLNESQKQTLLNFLNKNDDLFSEGLHDLGRTTLQTHVIDTGDAPPVKMPFYKQTPEMRRETQKQTQDMLKNDLIKESNSNWHSAVVLVKKANSDEYRFAVD